MIFGFNTDARFADTVYHVQSEARQHELRLETQVFVKGRCIGKHATSYAERMQEPGFSDEHIHEMLKDQHKHFVAAVRDGRIESELGERLEPTQPEPQVAAAHAAQSDVPTMIIEAPVPGAGAPEFFVVAPPEPPPEHAAPPIAPLMEPEPPPVHASSVPPTAELEPSHPAFADTAALELEPPVHASSVPPTAELEPPQPAFADTTVVAPVNALKAAARAGTPAGPAYALKPTGRLIGKGLSLECMPVAKTADGSAVTISVQITEESGPAAEAQVTCRITSGKAHAQYVYATSSETGVADVRLGLGGLDLTATALLIQVSHRGKSASRKYKLQTSS